MFGSASTVGTSVFNFDGNILGLDEIDAEGIFEGAVNEDGMCESDGIELGTTDAVGSMEGRVEGDAEEVGLFVGATVLDGS